MNEELRKLLPPLGEHPCPVCGKYVFHQRNSNQICTVCGWQDDVCQLLDPECTAGANEKSLKDYRTAYAAGWHPDWFEEDGDEKYEDGDTGADSNAAGDADTDADTDTDAEVDADVTADINVDDAEEDSIDIDLDDLDLPADRRKKYVLPALLLGITATVTSVAAVMLSLRDR